MKIFIDVDNTILEHYHFYSKDTENRTHRAISNNVKINKDAINFMYSSSITVFPQSLRKLWSEDNVYILTKYPNKEFDDYKQKKLAQVLNITQEELLNTKDKSGHQKYINVLTSNSKVQKVKDEFNVKNIGKFILIDDYSENIREWEEAGGLGVKFYNEYNSPTHPHIGFTISNFKVFEVMFEKKKISKIFLQYNKSLVMEEIVNYIFDKDEEIKKVNVDEEVYKNGLQRLNIDGNDFSYDYLNFSKEYYTLIKKLDYDYWKSFWLPYLKKNEKIVFKSSLDINLEDICKDALDVFDYLDIKIIQEKKNIRDADIFLTIKENINYIEGNKQLKKVKDILEELI